MKSLIIGLALIFASQSAFAQNTQAQAPTIDKPVSGEQVEAVSLDLYLIHAMHLANLSANRAVIGTYLAPGSQALHEQGFPILGRSAFLEIKLSFLVKPYGIDFSAQSHPPELDDDKALIDVSIESLNTSDEATVDQAFGNALDVIKAFETRILATAAKEGVSPAVREFALGNYGQE
ncbi:MAG: hypothetical protein EOP07_07040 [Proteobacteria bacterium]|nr:MAG: hypothetical protein EOP07_07040 [Pseudomonadota bacterium]